MPNLGDQIQAGAESPLDKLDEGVTLSDLLSFVDFPGVSQVTGLLDNFLPTNLLQIGSDGSINLPSLTDLQNLLQEGVGKITGYVEDQVTGILESLKGELIGTINNNLGNVVGELNQISPILGETAGAVANSALSNVERALNFNTNSLNYAGLGESINNIIRNSTSNLSPSDVQKLQDPEFFNNLKSQITNTALDNIQTFAVNNATNSTVNPQLSQSSYLNFMKLANQPPLNENGQYEIEVIRNAYWARGPQATAKSYLKKSTSGKMLVSNYSLASDGSKIFIGSKVVFEDEPNVIREVVDLDRRPKRRKIVNEMPYLFIFFETYNEAQEYLKTHSPTIKAIVTPS